MNASKTALRELFPIELGRQRVSGRRVHLAVQGKERECGDEEHRLEVVGHWLTSCRVVLRERGGGESTSQREQIPSRSANPAPTLHLSHTTQRPVKPTQPTQPPGALLFCRWRSGNLQVGLLCG